MQKHKAREDLDCLRHKIAKLENRSLAQFDDAPVTGACQQEKHHSSQVISYPKQSVVDRRKSTVLPFEDQQLNNALSGGIPLAALTEFRCEETRQTGAVSAFAWILAHQMQAFLAQEQNSDAPIIFIGEVSTRLEGGGIYPPGLISLGIDPAKCLFIEPRSLNDALWAAELAAKQTSVAATILEVRGNPHALDMAGTRRLHLRAQNSGRPFFLLRQAAQPEATAARIRFGIQSSQAGSRVLPSQQVFPNSLSRPAFQITLEKSKNPSPQSFILEWNNDSQSFITRTSDEHADAVDIHQNQQTHFGNRISVSGDRSDQTAEMGRVLAFG